MEWNQNLLLSHVTETVVVQPQEAQSKPDQLAQGLAQCVQVQTAVPFVLPSLRQDFIAVDRSELLSVLSGLKPASPGFDGVTVAILKNLAQDYITDVLQIINRSLEAACENPFHAQRSREGFEMDNIQRISLTSNLVKLIERIFHRRLTNHVMAIQAFSDAQIGFRRGCSIWTAHRDLESRIRMAM